jgi:hypothetical protein
LSFGDGTGSFKAGFVDFTEAAAAPRLARHSDALTPCKRSFFHELVWLAA